MSAKQKDIKQPEENTEFVKEELDPKRNYIFQKSGITKTGFIIILILLAIIIVGIIFSGLFLQDPTMEPLK